MPKGNESIWDDRRAPREKLRSKFNTGLRGVWQYVETYVETMSIATAIRSSEDILPLLVPYAEQSAQTDQYTELIGNETTFGHEDTGYANIESMKLSSAVRADYATIAGGKIIALDSVTLSSVEEDLMNVYRIRIPEDCIEFAFRSSFRQNSVANDTTHRILADGINQYLQQDPYSVEESQRLIEFIGKTVHAENIERERQKFDQVIENIFGRNDGEAMQKQGTFSELLGNYMHTPSDILSRLVPATQADILPKREPGVFYMGDLRSANRMRYYSITDKIGFCDFEAFKLSKKVRGAAGVIKKDQAFMIDRLDKDLRESDEDVRDAYRIRIPRSDDQFVFRSAYLREDNPPIDFMLRILADGIHQYANRDSAAAEDSDRLATKMDEIVTTAKQSGRWDRRASNIKLALPTLGAKYRR